MSVPRLFYCTVAGLVIATLLSFLFGASGLLNYHRLQAYERRVATGIAALEERHADLERLANLLRTEPELLRLLARDSGYYRADELVIRVGPQTPAAPVSPYAPDFADVGPLVQPKLPVPRDPFNVLALGLFLGLGLFTGLTVKRVLRSRAEQEDGALRADGAAGPDAVAGSVEDAFPAAGWFDAELPRGDVSTDATPDGVAAPSTAGCDGPLRQADAAEHVAEGVAASGDTGTQGAAGSAPAAGDAGVEPGPRRKRRRGRQRRGEVTVYRL